MDNIADNKTYYIIVENYEDQKKQGIVAVDSPTTANALTVIIKTEGEIIGVVGDEEGTPLVGAKVTLRDGQGQFVNSDTSTNIGAFTFKVTPGQYYVEVTLFGYEDYKGNLFTVEYKEVEDLGLITLTSKTGDLVVTVQSEGGDPLDATVTVKDATGNVIDTFSVVAGTASVEVVVGAYTLEADAPGYQAQIATNITIESGTTVSQDFVLMQATGSIKIYLTDIEGLPIAEAEVLVDDVSVGITDETGTLVIPDVIPGDRVIDVKKEGYTDYEDQIHTVNAEETLILELAMEKSAVISTTMLAGIAVICAAAVGVWFFLRGRGGTARTERKPARGKERSRVPTGARKQGLPKQSYRGR